MKKIIAIVVIVTIIVITGVAYASNHLVRIEKNYKYDKGMMNIFTGKTTAYVETIETMLFSGKLVNQSSEKVDIDFTAEMLAFNNNWTETQIEFR